MGIIREPDGIDFTVVPTTLTPEDRREISTAIAKHRRSHNTASATREAKQILARYEECRTSDSSNRGTRTGVTRSGTRLIHEREGLDFIEFIQSKPLTREDAAEISEFIRKNRAARAKARAAREKLEAKALALPSSERTQLAYQLLSSLMAEETDKPARQWASKAKAQFDKLQSPQTSSQPKKRRPRGVKSAKT